MEKIHIFIGSGPRFEEPTEALIKSIEQNCADPDRLDIHPMVAWKSAAFSNWKGQPTEESFGRPPSNGVRQWVTPFSLFRYAVPWLMDFEGYAIYLDCDMIVLGDIQELWDLQQPHTWRAAPGTDGDCVCVIDCSTFPLELNDIKNGNYGDKNRLRHIVNPALKHTLPHEWNHTDKYVEGRSKLIHYTSMKTQPFQPYPEVIDYEPHPDPRAADIYRHYARLCRTNS